MTTALMIAPYRQKNDGWGEAARIYAKGMIKAGVKLTLRPYYYTNDFVKKDDLDELLILAENTKYEKYDAIIQMVLPPDMAYFSPASEKNIAITFIESEGMLESPCNRWLDQFRLMDKVLVSSEFEKRQFPDSVNVSVIHQAYDTEWISADHGITDLIDKSCYQFYFIGSGAERKNLEMLIAAFHMEFNPSESVGLVIKAGEPSYIGNLCHNIKKKLGIRGTYIPEVIIKNDLSLPELGMLHKSCDCFVMPSAGECLCRPVLDALAFGNAAIVTEGTAMNEITGVLTVNSYKDNIVFSAHSAPGVHTPYEYWRQPIMSDLRKKLRFAFEKRLKSPPSNIESYSDIEIGKIIKNEIDA